MQRGHDVLIIGAGVIGCAIGRELAMRGARVRIFEARTVGAGATHASAGVLAPYIEAHDRGPLFDLTVRSLAMYDDFVASASDDSGIAIEYRRCGTLEVAVDATAASRLEGLVSAHPEERALVWLDAQETRRLEPGLQESIAGALFAPIHGYVAVPALMDALVWSALKHGLQLEAAHRATGLRSDGTTISVVTEDGTVWSATDVIVATGSWTGQIAVNERAAVAIRPVRGQLLRLGWRGKPLNHVVWGPDCYVVPWTDGTVLVGATVEEVGFDERATAAGVRDLLDAACELLPEAWRATFIEARVGLRPATPDGLPVVGRSTTLPSIVYATGHFRNGILLAPLTARIVADLILEGREDAALGALAPSRF